MDLLLLIAADMCEHPHLRARHWRTFPSLDEQTLQGGRRSQHSAPQSRVPLEVGLPWALPGLRNEAGGRENFLVHSPSQCSEIPGSQPGQRETRVTSKKALAHVNSSRTHAKPSGPDSVCLRGCI